MRKAVGTILAIMVIVWLGSWALNRHVVNLDASGRPLDAANASHYCLKCGRLGMRPGKGYWCHCTHCGLSFQAKIDIGESTIDW